MKIIKINSCSPITLHIVIYFQKTTRQEAGDTCTGTVLLDPKDGSEIRPHHYFVHVHEAGFFIFRRCL